VSTPSDYIMHVERFSDDTIHISFIPKEEMHPYTDPEAGNENDCADTELRPQLKPIDFDIDIDEPCYTTLGWAYAYFCSQLDLGVDPRAIEVPDFIAQAESDFTEANQSKSTSVSISWCESCQICHSEYFRDCLMTDIVTKDEHTRLNACPRCGST